MYGQLKICLHVFYLASLCLIYDIYILYIKMPTEIKGKKSCYGILLSFHFLYFCEALWTQWWNRGCYTYEEINTSDNFPKVPGIYFDQIVKNIQCEYLFESPQIENSTDVSEQQLKK